MGGLLWLIILQESRPMRDSCEQSVTLPTLARTTGMWLACSKSIGHAPSCFDAAHDRAGSVRGLPEDFALNPEYMEGFGR
jgi:hypothetical protein